MNHVTFPGLGLEFNLNPVAVPKSLFGWEIYWYGIIIALGFGLAVLFCLKMAKRFGIQENDLLDLLLFAVPCSIIGARTYYVLFYLDRFRHPDGSLDFWAMLQIHDGGIAVYGSLIGAFLTAYLVCRHKKIPFLAMADLGVFGLFIGQSVGRWGNFVNMEAYGGETTLPWRMGITDWVGGGAKYMEVHPTFLYESLWNALGFCLLLLVLHKGKRLFDGQLFFLYIAWYGLGRGFIEGLRTDSLMLFETGIRVSQLVGFLSFFAAAGYLIYRLRQHPDPQKLYVHQVTKKGEET